MSEPSVVIVIVDEDRFIRHFVRVALKAEHMHVFEAATGAAGVAAVGARRPDLIVVDTNLRDLGGTELIHALRACSAAPLVVLSALSAESDKVAALDAGADDYVTKPFGAAELIARMRAPAAASRRRAHRCGVRALRRRDRRSRRSPGAARRARVHLAIEFRLLAALAHHAGRLLTHDRLLSEVWARRTARMRTTCVYVGHLRRKLECDPRRPAYIVTETGAGYRLDGAR